MTDANFDPANAWEFSVELDQKGLVLFCQSISGISTGFDVVRYRANDESGKAFWASRPGIKGGGDFTCSRGVGNKEWWDWVKQVQDGEVENARQDGAVIVYRYNKELHRYNFKGGWPSQISVEGFGADSVAMLIETVTITHDGLELSGAGG